MLLLLVSLLSCSCMLAESNRSYNYVSLTCQTDIGSERNQQWWFNRTQLAESWCYNHIASSSDGSISVTVTPKCEGKVSCSAAGVTDNEKSIPHKPLAYPVFIYDSVVVVKAKEGSSVTLDCRVEISAQHNIEVNWKKNSSCPISSQRVLSDHSLRLSHTGTYVCEGTAKNLRDPVIVSVSAKIPEAPNLIGYLVAMKVCGVVSGVSISLGIVGVICLIVSYKRKLRNSQDAKLEMQVLCKREEDCNSSCSTGSHSNGTHFTITSNNEVILKTSGSISEYSV